MNEVSGFSDIKWRCMLKLLCGQETGPLHLGTLQHYTKIFFTLHEHIDNLSNDEINNNTHGPPVGFSTPCQQPLTEFGLGCGIVADVAVHHRVTSKGLSCRNIACGRQDRFECKRSRVTQQSFSFCFRQKHKTHVHSRLWFPTTTKVFYSPDTSSNHVTLCVLKIVIHQGSDFLPKPSPTDK